MWESFPINRCAVLHSIFVFWNAYFLMNVKALRAKPSANLAIVLVKASRFPFNRVRKQKQAWREFKKGIGSRLFSSVFFRSKLHKCKERTRGYSLVLCSFRVDDADNLRRRTVVNLALGISADNRKFDFSGLILWVVTVFVGRLCGNF